jgi:hypothetical protein
MLQRIQTVYWGLTLFCLGVLLSGVDLVSFKKDGIEFKLSIFSLKQFDKSDKLIKEFLTILITIQFILFSYSGMIVSNPASVKLNFWISLLLIACVFSVLAYLGVKKDKSLLDSVDRIR